MKISSADLRAASVYCKVLFDQQFVRVLISRLDAANRLIEQVPEPLPAATP
jgi:ribosome-binding factor A